MTIAWLLHPERSACVKRHQPAQTVGRLIYHTKIESLVNVIQEIIAADDPPTRLQQLVETLRQIYPANPSSKHMVGCDLGNFSLIQGTATLSR